MAREWPRPASAARIVSPHCRSAAGRSFRSSPAGGRPLNAASLGDADWATPLAELLTPLPTALHEIGERMHRHRAGTTRDTELAQLVEMVRARTVDLWLAVGRLRDAAVRAKA